MASSAWRLARALRRSASRSRLNRSTSKRCAFSRHASGRMREGMRSNSRTASTMAVEVCSRTERPSASSLSTPRIVSLDAPPAYAMTGVPSACASSGAMPKSSSAAKMNARAVASHWSRSCVRKSSQEPDVGSGGRLDAPALRTVADDHQPTLGQVSRMPRRSGRCACRAPAAKPSRSDRRAAATVRGGRNVDGRIDDGRLAIVAAPNAIGDVPGYRDEMVDARARRAIPRAKARQDRPGERAPQSPDRTPSVAGTARAGPTRNASA